MKRKMSWLVPTLALLATPALAQDRDENGRRQPGLFDISAQAGLLTFTGEAAGFTSPGVSFGVLAGADVLPWLGGEVSYQGAAYVTDARVSPAGDTDIGISENGGQLVAKVGPQLGQIQPYALGGVALSFLDVKDREQAFGVVEDATLIKVPVGAGIDWNIPGNLNDLAQFSVGARATYNVVVDSGAFPTANGAGADDQLQTTLQVGARF